MRNKFLILLVLLIAFVFPVSVHAHPFCFDLNPLMATDDSETLLDEEEGEEEDGEDEDGEEEDGDDEDDGDEEEEDGDNEDEEDDEDEEGDGYEDATEVSQVSIAYQNLYTYHGRSPVYSAKVVEGAAEIAYEGWKGSDNTVSYSKASVYGEDDDSFSKFQSGVTYTYSICINAKGNATFTDDVEVSCSNSAISSLKPKLSKDHQRLYLKNIYQAESVCNHAYKVKTTKATCVEGGYTTHICKYCGRTYVDNVTAPVGHTYELDETEDPTCTAAGYQLYVCSHCKDSYKKPLAMLEHHYVTEIEPASVDGSGKIEKSCTECEKIASTTIIPRIHTIKLSTTSYTYNGSVKKPAVTVLDNTGKTISSSYYNVYYVNNKNAGKGTVTIRFKGNYEGEEERYFTIKKASTALKVKKSSASYKKSTVAKKAQTFSIGASAKTKITYKESSKWITVTSAGKVTVKKGTPKGTYKVTVTAAKTTNYNSATKTITIKVT